MHLGRSLFFLSTTVVLGLPLTKSRAANLVAQDETAVEISEEEGLEQEAADAVVQSSDSEMPITETIEREEDSLTPTETSAEDVEIEKSPYKQSEEVSESGDTVVDYLMPYRKRRESWGSLITFGWSQYTPIEYEPDFVDSVVNDFDSYYGNAESPLIDFTVSVKKNYSWISFLLDIGAGYYKNEGKDDSLLTLIPARIGFGVNLDTLFDEPYIVPYATVGAYTVFYREATEAQAVNGNTLIAPYYNFGVRFQLDWIDRDGDYSSYDEQGMENTFLFVEARSFMASSSLPDLASTSDSPFELGAGISVEF
jgi:hypothetical protein